MSNVHYLEAAYAAEKAAELSQTVPLIFGGGGGTSVGMDVVDAKIAAAEARTDTKFAELMGELRVIESSTSGLKTTIITTGIVTTLSIVAIVVATFGWGTAMFGTGMDAQTIADRAATGVESRLQFQLEASAARYEELSARLDALATESSSSWAEVIRAIEDARARSDASQGAPGNSP